MRRFLRRFVPFAMGAGLAYGPAHAGDFDSEVLAYIGAGAAQDARNLYNKSVGGFFDYQEKLYRVERLLDIVSIYEAFMTGSEKQAAAEARKYADSRIAAGKKCQGMIHDMLMQTLWLMASPQDAKDKKTGVQPDIMASYAELEKMAGLVRGCDIPDAGEIDRISAGLEKMRKELNSRMMKKSFSGP